MIHLEEVTFTLLIHLVSDCWLEQLLNRCRNRILLPGEADLCRAGMQLLGCFSGKQKSAWQQYFCLVNRWRASCMVISLECSRHCYLKLWMVVFLAHIPGSLHRASMPLLFMGHITLLELEDLWLQPWMSDHLHVLCKPLSGVLYITLYSCLLSRFAGDITKCQVLLLLSWRHNLWCS